MREKNFKVGDVVIRNSSCEDDPANGMIGGQSYVVTWTDGKYMQLEGVNQVWSVLYFDLAPKVDVLPNPHVHAELIKKWADGHIIQRRVSNSDHGDFWETWETVKVPSWEPTTEYRVKPAVTKPLVYERRLAFIKPMSGSPYLTWYDDDDGVKNMRVTVNPDTKEILNIEKI